ncbi:MAG: FtsH protease activity modulator HflK [Holosporales bacterium]
MAWQDGDGPWGSRGKGPWGGGNGGGKGPTPPDLEKILKQRQEELQRLMNKYRHPGKMVGLGLLVLALLWLSSGFYRVSEGELGVELRFGKFTTITQPGLRYHFPSPIEQAIVTKVSQLNRVDSGIASTSVAALQSEESRNFMLTGDENIVSVTFTVFWSIKDVKQFLFNNARQEQMVKFAAESAVREVIAQTPIASALTTGRAEVAEKAQGLLQGMMDEYGLGILIHEVRLQSVDPPEQVRDAFLDVQRARADRESKINDAKSYQNAVVPRARGEAQQILQAAEAYRQSVVAAAQGETQRFLAVLQQYKAAPEVTKKRLYIDGVGGLLKEAQKMVLPNGKAQSTLPYLPLPGLKASEPAKKPAQENAQ